MKHGKLIATMLALPMLFTGCDGIFAVDNMDPPESLLTGRVVANGQPVGVRIPTASAQLLLWQTDWDRDNPNRIEASIPVYLETSGEFSALLYDGEYEVEVVNSAGPWQNVPNRIPITVRGATTLEIPVSPFHTVQDPTVTYNQPTTAQPGGSVTATFRVRQHVTSPLVDVVGVYVNTTPFVDRTRVLTNVPQATRERTRTQIQTQLNTNGTITITVPLPADIHKTPSPDRRNEVYVRVGVKPVGSTELAYSPLIKVAI